MNRSPLVWIVSLAILLVLAGTYLKTQSNRLGDPAENVSNGGTPSERLAASDADDPNSAPGTRLATSSSRVEDHPLLDRQAPAWTLPDLDGGSRRLEDFRGKPLIVSYWTTW